MTVRGGDEDWVLEPIGESMYRILDRDSRERLGVAIRNYESWTVRVGARQVEAPTRREALDGMACWLARLPAARCG